jgi:hypothetical protein
MDPAQDTSASIAADNANAVVSACPVTAYLGIQASVAPESIQSIQDGVVSSMKSFMADWVNIIHSISL